MLDIIKLRKPLPEGSKSEFEDVGELLDYLNALHEDEGVVLYELSEDEITDEIREAAEKVTKMDPKDYFDIL